MRSERYVWSEEAPKLQRKSSAQPAGNPKWRRGGKTYASLLECSARLLVLASSPSSYWRSVSVLTAQSLA